ncbi:acetyl esterase [Endozoicomonas atrinae]|uniref:acetyl esterase n=1 Tax=Endozoicomonas atrinae TaxID=1333660 RepID=UPI003B00F9EE
MNKVDVLSRLSEEMTAALHCAPQVSGQEICSDPLQQMRSDYEKGRAFWNEGGPQMHKINELDVEFEGGHVRTRLYYPTQRLQSPALIYIHGGGFIVGSMNTHDRIMRILAEASGAVVIGIDYTLSPEAKYPQAIEECVAVSQFFLKHGHEHGIDCENMGYAGDSAGAYLSLASYLWQRDAGMDIGYIKCLLLYYGLYGLKDSCSRKLYGGEWDGLTKEDLEYYQEMYLNSDKEIDAAYYCLFNNNLSENIPPSFIASSEFDPLLDDSEALYKIFESHGIECEYKMYLGTLHAFLHYSKVMNASNQALSDGVNYFLQCLKYQK